MSAYSSRPASRRIGLRPLEFLQRLVSGVPLQRGTFFGLIIIGALLAFETFNYTTTDFALGDLLGELRFAGIRWSTILALAFCGIDFAGIAKLLSPRSNTQEPFEAWYLLGAWFLAATMNAMLTWWAVSLAILQHQHLGNEILARETLVSSVPVFVALLVWLIRVLMIGSFTLAGSRLFSQGASRRPSRRTRSRQGTDSRSTRVPMKPTPTSRPVRPAPKPHTRREPTYQTDPILAHPQSRRPN